ncbi:MAG: hypothetical protein M3X11_21055 [Acidobacteriota bacterium]|nr:hypothetical protein [Acidobacteriota bacterium]
MTTENRLLLSEGATSRHAGINVNTLRKYRAAGLIHPTLDMPGVICQYDAAAVKVFFETDPGYLKNKTRAAGKRVMATSCGDIV